ncbi:uncharacterized protein [Leuresthes tenuis]|uniref:uncharacterized protein n=1 Tax=Leuresthes tenuis TaxID=355514 RepID=UPI003B507A82
MSATMSKADGVTVFTLNTDPQSFCPPLCQIFKALCYSRVCCSVSQHLRSVLRTSLSVLGALQIMIGSFNIGLGAILRSSNSGVSWVLNRTEFPYWLGALFIAFGVLCILSERYPSRCLVFLNVMMSLAGVAFAITAIVMYSIYISQIDVGNMCNDYRYNYYGSYGSRYNRRITPTPTPTPYAANEILQEKEKCNQGKMAILMLLRGLNGVLILLSVLELCVAISSVVLGIKALRSAGKEHNKSPDDPELYKALLEEVTTKPAA